MTVEYARKLITSLKRELFVNIATLYKPSFTKSRLFCTYADTGLVRGDRVKRVAELEIENWAKP